MRKLVVAIFLLAATAAATDFPMPGQRAKFRPNQSRLTSFSVTFDGAGSAIAANAKAELRAPIDCSIISWFVTSDTSTTSVVDVWAVRCPGWPYVKSCSAYPPTVSNTIAGNKPTLTAATNAGAATNTSWKTKLLKGDAIKFNVDSNNNATKLYVTFVAVVP